MLKWQDNLQLYLDNNLNVLLAGHGGTGKTSVVKDLFQKEFGDDWLYIAGATCDPFTDLLGIPRPVKDEESGKDVLDFIKPKKLQLNKVKAIFCDEYNRAPKKVMNALMEIIQFKSLGNEPVPNLRMVWCAVNPDDADYNLEERLDRSQKDRFHIWIDVPYLLDTDYFVNQYGKEIADGAQEFWSELSEEVKKEISPRRLQYAIDIWKIGGSLREVLPKSANISKLVSNLKNGSLASQLEKIFDDDDKTIKDKLKDSNLMNAVKNRLDDPRYVKKFVHLLPQEILVEKAPSNFEMCEYIKKHSNKFDTALISTLDKLGCFTQSDFGPCFAAMKKGFVGAQYNARLRTRFKKTLSCLPDLNKATIRTADLPDLQNLLNLFNAYGSKSNHGTVMRDDAKIGFLAKLDQIQKLNEANKLGLDFVSTNYGWHTPDYWIKQYQNKVASQPVSTTTSNQNYVAANPFLRTNPIIVTNGGVSV